MEPSPFDRDGRTAPWTLGSSLDSQLLQGIDQVADRTTAHAGDAIESEVAMAQRNRRSQEADGRTAIPHEELGVGSRDFSTASQHLSGLVLGIMADRDAQSPQRIEHHASIVTVEHTAQSRGT